MSLPIKCKTFQYIKKEYNNDILKFERKMTRELYSFFMGYYEFLTDIK